MRPPSDIQHPAPGRVYNPLLAISVFIMILLLLIVILIGVCVARLNGSTVKTNDQNDTRVLLISPEPIENNKILINLTKREYDDLPQTYKSVYDITLTDNSVNSSAPALSQSADVTAITYLYDDGIFHGKYNLWLSQRVYQHFTSASRTYSYQGDSPPLGWENAYWNMFTTDTQDILAMDDIIAQTKKIVHAETGDVVAEALVHFVQNMPYDYTGAGCIADGSGSYSTCLGSNKKVQYPYETLWLGSGTCTEKSLLLAKLLSRLGYGVVLFNFKSENHMAVGIQCPLNVSNYGSGYCFIESTKDNPIGMISSNYIGGADIKDSRPQIIIVGSGRTFTSR